MQRIENGDVVFEDGEPITVHRVYCSGLRV